MVQLPRLADCRLSNVLEHPAGVEPARPTWQAGRLPLHHGCVAGLPFRARSRARNGKPVTSVGPEGLEPSRRWLRARNAAANTLVPSVGPEGVGPSPHRLKGEYAAITPRPQISRDVAFSSLVPAHVPSPPSSPGRNCTCLGRRIRPPCCCYNTGPSVARKGVEPFWGA